ncbi:hypothetical protein DITRI_Ditri03aG0025600 [Diplodiscus trichospermus]
MNSVRWLVGVVHLLVWGLTLQTMVQAIPPPPPVQCNETVCILNNAFGVWEDRKDCLITNVAYPTSEEELRLTVAYAAKNKLKVKVVSKFAHCLTKLACPSASSRNSLLKGTEEIANLAETVDSGVVLEQLVDEVEETGLSLAAAPYLEGVTTKTPQPGDSLLISTAKYDSNIEIDSVNLNVTVDAGVALRDLIDKVEEAGLSLAASTYWEGLSVAGLISTGSHGSSWWGNGGAVHDHVIGISLVVPASKSEGYAKIIQIGPEDPLLNAAKVSLGLLGVISKVKFSVDRGFKRSITFNPTTDSMIENEFQEHAKKYEFADITWHPSRHIAVYRYDNRVSMDTPGDGINDFIDMQPNSIVFSQSARAIEKAFETARNASAKCSLGVTMMEQKKMIGYGLKSNGQNFIGYPVVGRQGKMQTSGSCLYSSAADSSCIWDPRITNGVSFSESSAIFTASKLGDFIRDVKRLRDLDPESFCGMDLYVGFLMRYIKASKAYLGQSEDSIVVDFSYYHADDGSTPRLNQDVIGEVEQMAFFKYGARPHWAKNRKVAFLNVQSKYPNHHKFLEAKQQLDPENMFSSEWSDEILFGKVGDTSDGCALDGLCICTEDRHCSPSKGYFCKPGLVYKEARVCRYSPSSMV